VDPDEILEQAGELADDLVEQAKRVLDGEAAPAPPPVGEGFTPSLAGEGSTAIVEEESPPSLGSQPPARLSRFAPPDPEGERRTRERLSRMTGAALRSRRNRIDARLHELGLEIGEAALEIPSVRGTGLVDVDRILRKIARIDDVREQARLERDGTKPSGLLQAAWMDLQWLGEMFNNRELRTRRNLLVSELGLALCACDHQVLGTYAAHVKALMDENVAMARRVDELFIEARMLDEEFERRVREGLNDEPPKDIDRLLAKAKDSVDDVASKAGDTLVDFGKSAASAAARTSGQAAWLAARGVAKGAWHLGTRPFRGDGDEAADEEAIEGAPPPPRDAPRQLPLDASGPAPRDIPEILRDLARLRDEGILTEDEFARKKAELLRRL
jgi:hypothetical protein